MFTGVGKRLDQPQENQKRYQKERSGRRMRDLGEAGWCDSPKDRRSPISGQPNLKSIGSQTSVRS